VSVESAVSSVVSDPPAVTESGETNGASPRRRVRRLMLTGIVLALVAMWGYVLYLAFGPGRQPPVDRLDDPAFAAAAESRCADAVGAVEELPFANELPTATERADVLDQANGIFATMLDDLDSLTTLAPPGEQREAAGEWLTDWRVLLGNRTDYADALRADANARPLISEKGDTGRHITGWIDEFALANRMPSCATPTDV
jgi:hypothetical protein